MRLSGVVYSFRRHCSEGFMRIPQGFIPRGSEYPNSTVLGPQVHTLNGFWTLKPYYLGTWTLRDWN